MYSKNALTFTAISSQNTNVLFEGSLSNGRLQID